MTLIDRSDYIAIEILVDEAEAYISAVGDEDDAREKIRWAIRKAQALLDAATVTS